ncbi:MAG: helix-turn-helix transcriptional regulator [Clostridia bacterium]|nr:helix-turn-helix transcriptional regulator [Clostridia bacterium]
MNSIGNVIAKLRKNNEMTQEELAVKIGVSAQTISKWETGSTMPDILLLPVIADVFNVTIDFLFGKEYHNTALPIEHNEFAEKIYKEFLYDLYRGFLDKETVSDEVLKNVEDIIEYWDRHPDSQMLMQQGANRTTDRYCGAYGNKDLGIIWRRAYNDSLKLLEDDNAGKFLADFSNKDFRKIMVYQLENPYGMFTVDSIALKCDIAPENARPALEKLVKYNFTDTWEVDLGEETKNVYSATHQHKMMLVFAIMSLAQRLANYKEQYRGFNN